MSKSAVPIYVNVAQGAAIATAGVIRQNQFFIAAGTALGGISGGITYLYVKNTDWHPVVHWLAGGVTSGLVIIGGMFLFGRQVLTAAFPQAGRSNKPGMRTKNDRAVSKQK